MGTLSTTGGQFDYQWASDVSFDGVRLEVLTTDNDVLLDVSIPAEGDLTINTFSNEIPANLIVAAVEVARTRK